MIGRVNYVGVNVRVWYLCSGNCECRNTFMVELENLFGGRILRNLVDWIIFIRQALF